MQHADGIRYFLWHASRDVCDDSNSNIPYLSREIRELIWYACFPLVWMRCKTCRCTVLFMTEGGQLISAINRYYIIQGHALCEGCFDER